MLFHDLFTNMCTKSRHPNLITSKSSLPIMVKHSSLNEFFHQFRKTYNGQLFTLNCSNKLMIALLLLIRVTETLQLFLLY